MVIPKMALVGRGLFLFLVNMCVRNVSKVITCLQIFSVETLNIYLVSIIIESYDKRVI